MRIASDKKSLSSRLVHSISVRVNPAFDSYNRKLNLAVSKLISATYASCMTT